MTTSRTSILSKPSGDARIKRSTLAYVLARGRQQAYNLIVSELKKSGISQATLARRLNKGTDQISRLLKRPSNIEVDTLAAVLFALSGGFLSYDLTYPSTHVSEFPKARETGTDERASYINSDVIYEQKKAA